MWRTVLALMLLTSQGRTQIAQPGEAATPPAQQPAYAALAAKYFSETMADRASFENFEISELRCGWLACILSITAICGLMRYSYRTMP